MYLEMAKKPVKENTGKTLSYCENSEIIQQKFANSGNSATFAARLKISGRSLTY